MTKFQILLVSLTVIGSFLISWIGYTLDANSISYCKDLTYGQYYTTVNGFYRNQSLLAVRYNGGTSASFLILPDNGEVKIKCSEVIELEVD